MAVGGQPGSSRQVIRFGPFELDTGTGELRKQGIRIRLQSKPLQILCALIEKPDVVVTREELRLRLWPDTFVDFERGLNTAINRLRMSLGDSAENPRYIETFARTGYRFIAPVTGMAATAAEPPVQAAAPRVQRWRWMAFGACALVTAGALYPLLRQGLPEPVRFGQITFRRGQVSGARFAPEGRDIIYTAQWENSPRQLYTVNSASRESRLLGFSELSLGAVSRNSELALLRNGGIMNITGGALLRASINGGALQPVDNNIMAVDWAPDGMRLLAARALGGAQQLEFPLGRPIYKTPGWLSNVRVSPSGGAVAFVSHPVRHDDAGSIMLADSAGNLRTLTEQWASASGVAWHPSGHEIWFTAARDSTHRAVWAVNLSGRLRAIGQAPGMLSLRDIAPDGRALLTIESRRLEMAGMMAGETGERSFSLMDWSRVQELSPNGDLLVFDESGEGAHSAAMAYLRNTRTGETIRLGEGFAQGLSPDGRSVLLLDARERKRLFVVPLSGGAGAAMPDSGLWYQWARYFPDGEHLLVLGSEPGQSLQIHIQTVKTGKRTPLTKPMMVRNVAISPDGHRVAALTPDGKLVVYQRSSGESQVLPFDEPLAPLRWSRDGQWLFVQHMRRQTELPALVSRLRVETGELLPWKKLSPPDPMGVNSVTGVAIADDEESYVYSYRRVLSDLYIAEGWR